MASVTAAGALSVTACPAPGIRAAARARDRVGHRLAVRGEQVASRGDQDERRHGDVREVGAAASRQRRIPAALVGQVLGREHPGRATASGLASLATRHQASITASSEDQPRRTADQRERSHARRARYC